MMTRLFACTLALLMAPIAGYAAPADNVLQSIERLGIDLDKSDQSRISAYFEQAFAQAEDAGAFTEGTERLMDLAELSQSAARPARKSA